MSKILGYYSHPLNISSKKEFEEYQSIINRYKGAVLNPTKEIATPNPFEMNVYWRVIEQVNYIIVSTINGKIGRCSYYEVKQGLNQGIPVHEIYAVGKSFKYRKVIGLEITSEKNLKKYSKLICVPMKNIISPKNNYK